MFLLLWWLRKKLPQSSYLYIILYQAGFNPVLVNNLFWYIVAKDKNYCKQIIYYVSTTDEGIPFLVGHNIEQWKEQVEKQVKKDINEKEGNEEYEEEYEDQLTKLIADIINNKYTEEEAADAVKEYECRWDKFKK